MLRTRLWMGAVLIALTVGVLVFDQRLAPWYPFLLVLVLALALGACFELLVLSSWLVPLVGVGAREEPWFWITAAFAFTVLAAFLTEMARFQEPGESVLRIALTVWVVAYLGVLPCFLAQLRWLNGAEPEGGHARGTLALALAIFVPKCGDIGAYFTGRLLGRHPMAPVLSPKKTWEGAAGALVVSVLAALGIASLGPAGWLATWKALGLGLSVGVVGLLGDLAESLIKRDCRRKDASQVVPGFGGILDVVDAILFAAPVSYWWLS
jgi:phosphatidate cytidylyltransferase